MKICIRDYISYIYVLLKYMHKKCFYCCSNSIVKNGHKDRIHRYLCKSCGRSFIIRKVIDSEALWREYVFGKQTVIQLGERYGISPSTVRRKLDGIRVQRFISSQKNEAFSLTLLNIKPKI
jgi:transposase-like protein